MARECGGIYNAHLLVNTGAGTTLNIQNGGGLTNDVGGSFVNQAGATVNKSDEWAI